MKTIELTSENFDAETKSGSVLIDFWASWCGPCKMLSPIVDEFADENDGIKVCKVNIDEQMELAMRFNIVSIPTLIAMRGGEQIGKVVGYCPKSNIEALFE